MCVSSFTTAHCEASSFTTAHCEGNRRILVTFFRSNRYFMEVYNLELNDIKDVYNEIHQKIFNDICKLCQRKTTSKKITQMIES